MEVDAEATRPKKSRDEIMAMRESFKQKMEAKKNNRHKPIKLSTKTKVISKGTAYSDKFESRRRQRLSTGSKRGVTGAAMNKLGQKHAKLSLSNVHGMALTKAQKKRQLKKQAREAKFLKGQNASMEDNDWESASSEEELEEQQVPAQP